jgi:C1A family cysteine protease
MIYRRVIPGWIPDIPDQRDYLFSSIAQAIEIPKRIDLSQYCTEIEDQGSLGSCTACALTSALEFLKKKEDQKSVNYSRLFLYYNERKRIYTTNFDSGAMLRDGIKSLKQEGCCYEQTWPYIVTKFTEKPSVIAYAEATESQIISYFRIRSFDEMRKCLAEGYPFVFGFSVYESMMTRKVAKDGKVQMPLKGDRLLGGHAVMCVGLNEKLQRFIIRNSWGQGWGVAGYFTLPYEYLQSDDLADDFWAIRVMEK